MLGQYEIIQQDSDLAFDSLSKYVLLRKDQTNDDLAYQFYHWQDGALSLVKEFEPDDSFFNQKGDNGSVIANAGAFLLFSEEKKFADYCAIGYQSQLFMELSFLNNIGSCALGYLPLDVKLQEILGNEFIQTAIALGKVTDEQVASIYTEKVKVENLEEDKDNTIKGYLQQKLPSYMVPEYLIELDKLPLSANGKVDRNALPEIDVSFMSEEYVAPRNEIEQKLAEIWSDILKIDKSKVGIYDNFFHLGGHSLLAIQLVARIHAKLNCEIIIKNLFDKPKLMDLALFIEGGIKEGAGVAYSPIKKTKILKDGNAMSFAQERLWFLDQLEEGKSANYNMPMALRLEGGLNIEALAEAFNQIIMRQESLRTVFQSYKGHPVQKILSELKISLKIIEANKEDILHIIDKDIHKPFDLQKGPLIRVKLFKLEDSYILFINKHHIISDGWSKGIFFSELEEFYSAICENRESNLKPLKIQYVDFSAWEKKHFTAELRAEGLRYWKDYLEDYVPLLLPVDKLRPAVQSMHGGHHSVVLNKDTTNLLNNLSRKEGATLSMTLLSAYQILLGRLSGQSDILVGMGIANRTHSDLHNLIGFFVNKLPMRQRLESSDTFIDILIKSKKDSLNAYEYQNIPFERIVDELQVERRLDRMPLVQHVFVLQNTANKNSLNFSGIKTSSFKGLEFNTTKFDITFSCMEVDERLFINIEYNSDIFLLDTIKRLGDQYLLLLEQITKNPDKSINDYVLLDTNERKQILVDWNDTTAPYPKDKTIYQLFEEQAHKTPNNIAVIFEDNKLCYNDLNKKSNQLARLIRKKYKAQYKKDLKPDSLVGLCVERSLDMIIGILGILKAGGAYVPLDPDYPQDRLEYMIEDLHEGLVITQKDIVDSDGYLDKLHYDELLVIDSDEVQANLAKQSSDNLYKISGANDLAYVIYTSGSTGRPKGVMVEHKSVNNLVCNSNYVNFSKDDKVLQAANISFDAATFEIWEALLNGLTLVQISESDLLNIASFKTFLENHQISIMWMTVALFDQYINEDSSIFKGLKYLLVGGDALSPENISQLLSDKCKCPKYVLNGYGPTESTTFTTTFNIKKVDVPIPIGTPINNTTCYILDNNLNPCPIGTPGELYVGGAGLARGYLNQEELTKKCFIANPFAKELGLSNTDRIYKTGDLARWLPDANIEYLGRTDFQVKIRGYRIELGEIENVLAKHESISQTCVVAKSDDEQDSNKQLIAYCVLKDTQQNDSDITEDTRKDFVEQWEDLYDDVYQKDIDHTNTFDIVGWKSSFTNEAIPEEEMHEWVDAIVERICLFSPKNILEVGCGTGLLLYPLVNRCKSYFGIDFSKPSISRLQNSFKELEINNAAVCVGYANRLQQLPLDIQNKPVDTVVINSVAQYFPNQAYLDEVIEQSVGLIDSGRIILGDIRDYRLLDAFHVAVQIHQHNGDRSLLKGAKIKQQAIFHSKRERELLLDPCYFINLKDNYSAIKHVEVLPKRGNATHEMNYYRYDVVLHIEHDESICNSKNKNLELDWIFGSSNINIDERLANNNPTLAIKAYPNKRVFKDVAINEGLAKSDNVTVVLEQAGQQQDQILALETLADLANKYGYKFYSHLNMQSEAHYDLVFYRADVPAQSFVIDYGVGKYTNLSNNPLASSMQKNL